MEICHRLLSNYLMRQKRFLSRMKKTKSTKKNGTSEGQY